MDLNNQDYVMFFSLAQDYKTCIEAPDFPACDLDPHKAFVDDLIAQYCPLGKARAAGSHGFNSLSEQS